MSVEDNLLVSVLERGAAARRDGLARAFAIFPELEARRHQLAVRLLNYRVRLIQVRTHRRGDFAIAIKAGIQRAIRVVTRQCKIRIAAIVAIPRHHQLAIRLLDYRSPIIIVRTNRRGDFAGTAAKAEI